ncbi:MAG: enoyl-CoA hydratase/isomerase family protein [Caulobacter sp.]
MEPVLYAELDGVAHVTLNRPERLNAINAALASSLADALRRAVGSTSAEVIVLSGAGRAFCAGDDLDEFSAGGVEAAGAEAFIADLQEATRLIMLGPKPVICAVQGWVVGGGAAWPLNADFCLVAQDAVMFCPEASHGLFPTGGATVLLAERAGQALANRILWLGERLSADQMVAAGIASAVVPAATLMDEATALARRLMALPAASRRRLKAARAADLADRLERAMALETRNCLEAAFDAEARERVAATRS